MDKSKLIKIIQEILIEDIEQKKQYIGQCDKLRRNCNVNENYWQDMMMNRKKISFKLFVDSVDMLPLLDEDETPETFIKEKLMSDSESAAYKSNWGNKPCMFFQTAGFEFIFV